MSDATGTPPELADALRKNAEIGGSRMIEYGGMQLLAPLRDIRAALQSLRAGDRGSVMRSVAHCLARNFPKVKAGTATQKQAMNCAQDIVIWFANEIIEGRATLETN